MVLALYGARRDITLDELRRELGQAGVTVAISTLHRFFARHGMGGQYRRTQGSAKWAPRQLRPALFQLEPRGSHPESYA